MTTIAYAVVLVGVPVLIGTLIVCAIKIRHEITHRP